MPDARTKAIADAVAAAVLETLNAERIKEAAAPPKPLHEMAPEEAKAYFSEVWSAVLPPRRRR